MRTLLILAAAIGLTALLALHSRADLRETGTKVTINGVLIDQACGAGMLSKDNPEKEAESHTKACATKDACEKSGYAVIAGKEMIKFDDEGNLKAKDFLKKTDKADNLRVTVEGVRTGGTLAVSSLKAEGEK